MQEDKPKAIKEEKPKKTPEQIKADGEEKKFQRIMAKHPSRMGTGEKLFVFQILAERRMKIIHSFLGLLQPFADFVAVIPKDMKPEDVVLHEKSLDENYKEKEHQIFLTVDNFRKANDAFVRAMASVKGEDE